MRVADDRLSRPHWDAGPRGDAERLALRLLIAIAVPLALWYFGWLLQPERIGNPWLFGVLIAAELFNLTQAVGFWWTCVGERRRQPAPTLPSPPDVDVFIPVYGEPVKLVEKTVVAASLMRGASVRVAVLDDGDSDEMRAMAERNGVGYIRRPEHSGAKAGNINHALGLTSAPFLAVFDSDHMPTPNFLEATLGHFEDPRMAFVQTPQYYANGHRRGVAGAAWAQQALFFGAIARGKDSQGAIFCCGTNVVFRRPALEDVGGFPTRSLTEDFELSIELHERGWDSAYVAEVLARGLGPEDMASYVGQQQRWARGCLSAIPRVLRARLPLRRRIQYGLSAMYFLSGWTVLVYMSMPVIRILTGEQPLAGISADEFLLHFAPYFVIALAAVAVAGRGAFTFAAFALAAASFWIQIMASIMTLLRRAGGFVVTPKEGVSGRQPGAVAPALAAATVLVAVSAFGLIRDRSPATLNNVAFALLHVSVLLSGAWAALVPPRRESTSAGRELPPLDARAPT